jgi:hypothetical protein
VKNERKEKVTVDVSNGGDKEHLIDIELVEIDVYLDVKV